MRGGLLLGLAFFLGAASLGLGGPATPMRERHKVIVTPHGRASRMMKMQPQERSIAIASGSVGLGAPLALRVYDPDGNCVAWDDRIMPVVTADDVMAEWFVPEVGSYTIELTNLGSVPNTVQMVVR